MTKEKARKVFEKLKIMHPSARCELNFTTPFELLVAVILSAQCTDKRVNIITDKLFKVYNTPKQFAYLDVEELSSYIRSCGFFNAKSKNIIAMSKIVWEKYGGEVPKDFEKLTCLPGVGRKTASVVMSVAFGIPAMPVDTHVNRVSLRIGFSKGTSVDKVEEDLKRLLPKELWNEFHHYMIFHGRYICQSRKPNCQNCLIKEDCKCFLKAAKKINNDKIGML
ncbi:MAG: endonuclease III [Clostridiales bacterium]|mgnify:CR=1 FL=1|nr:endonuclease III [Clostridiales bacterium]